MSITLKGLLEILDKTKPMQICKEFYDSPIWNSYNTVIQNKVVLNSILDFPVSNVDYDVDNLSGYNINIKISQNDLEKLYEEKRNSKDKYMTS